MSIRDEILNFQPEKRGSNQPIRPARTHCAAGHELDDENVYVYSNGPGRRPYRRCVTCSKASAKRWQEANPGRFAELLKSRDNRMKFQDPAKVRSTRMKRKYGIDQAGFDAILAAQGGTCPICAVPLTAEKQLDAKLAKAHVANSAVVDHCHTTKKVRGVLCMRCNSGLGYFSDNVAALEAAIAYLKVPR